MNEILITLTLLIPPASKGVHWGMNEVPNQQVPCHTKPTKEGWAVYHTKSMGQEVCYLTDTNYPMMVRGPWKTTTKKTYNPK